VSFAYLQYSVVEEIPDRDFEHFLLMSAFIPQSIEEVRPAFPRWRRRLRELGITNIPPMHSQRPADAYAITHLTLLALQSCRTRHKDIEHNLRNLTLIRPHHN